MMAAGPRSTRDDTIGTHEQNLEPIETEAKLRASLRAFREIAPLEAVAGWRVIARRTVHLRDTYWDTSEDRLLRADCTLRVRELDGKPQGELTFKAPKEPALARGASQSRAELVAAVPAGSGPAQWATVDAARPILDALAQRGAAGALRPVVVLLNPRRELVLQQNGNEAILSLDEVRIEGQSYCRRYVEIELKRGSRAAVDELASAVQQQFRLQPAQRGKVQAAREWLARRVMRDE
jgi:inorganic triphosphatase YgiF